MSMDKKVNKRIFLKKIAAIAAASLIMGCASSPKPAPPQVALGRWNDGPINADGSKKDWPGSTPQYKDSETDTKMWINNDAKQLYLLAEVKNPEIARQLTQGNVILSVKTGEKDAKPFSIKLKGHTPLRPRSGPGHDPNKEDTKDISDSSAMHQDRPPEPKSAIKLPDDLVVTYPFSSGPVTMSMKEARSTGIAISLADAGPHTLIFEAVISFDAIFYNVPPIAGTVIDITLSAKDRAYAMERRENSNKNQPDRPKGGPPEGTPPGHGSSDGKHGPGNPDDMKQTKSSHESFSAAVEITLAGPSK